MYFRSAALTLLALAVPASAFVGKTAFSRSLVSVQSSVDTTDASLQAVTKPMVCSFVCVYGVCWFPWIDWITIVVTCVCVYPYVAFRNLFSDQSVVLVFTNHSLTLSLNTGQLQAR